MLRCFVLEIPDHYVAGVYIEVHDVGRSSWPYFFEGFTDRCHVSWFKCHYGGFFQCESRPRKSNASPCD